MSAPDEILLRLIGYTTAPIVVAPYLSKRTREELRRHGLNYFSPSGPQMHVELGSRPVYEVVER